ncbi:MAG: hypothetical protein ABFD89_09960 [Bryobacteraceae bacterium]
MTTTPHTSVTLGQWIGDLDTAVAYMDDEIREHLHNDIAPCDDQVFLDTYCATHMAKFGADFVIN